MRIDGDRILEFPLGFLWVNMLRVGPERDAEIVVRFGKARIQLNCLGELLRCVLELALAGEGDAKVVMSFGQ